MRVKAKNIQNSGVNIKWHANEAWLSNSFTHKQQCNLF